MATGCSRTSSPGCGVHKGERIDPQDYYWNDIVNPDIALEYQAQGRKWTQSGATPQEYVNHQMTNFLTPQQYDSTVQQVGLKDSNVIDPVRSQRMQRLLPRWK